jgi:hypothetical protein
MRIATLSLGGLVLAAALISSTPMRLSSYDAKVNELLARMTLDEKIGQMTQADKQYVKDLTEVGCTTWKWRNRRFLFLRAISERIITFR